MSLKKSFGKQLKEFREHKRHMTQADVCGKAEISGGVVSHWETGRKFPQAKELEAVLKVLNAELVIKDKSGATGFDDIEFVLDHCPDLDEEFVNVMLRCIGLVMFENRRGAKPRERQREAG